MLKLSRKNIKEIITIVNRNNYGLTSDLDDKYNQFILFTLLLLLSLFTPNYSLANNQAEKPPNYDLIAITPKTWQQVKLKYSDVINGKKYPAEIKLLRPIKWLQENSMNKVGSEVNLSIPEFGVMNVKATVTAIKPNTLDTSEIDWSTQDSRPVITIFKRYAPVVKTYAFRDLGTGEISTINATPNHPFYVKNKGKFMPIEDVAPTDQLVNSSGQTIKLICDKGQNSHCGKAYNTDGDPVPVYNLEIYQQHAYFVGNDEVLVHNNCDILTLEDGSRIDLSMAKRYASREADSVYINRFDTYKLYSNRDQANAAYASLRQAKTDGIPTVNNIKLFNATHTVSGESRNIFVISSDRLFGDFFQLSKPGHTNNLIKSIYHYNELKPGILRQAKRAFSYAHDYGITDPQGFLDIRSNTPIRLKPILIYIQTEEIRHLNLLKY